MGGNRGKYRASSRKRVPCRLVDWYQRHRRYRQESDGQCHEVARARGFSSIAFTRTPFDRLTHLCRLQTLLIFG